jgi:hypothetical protein
MYVAPEKTHLKLRAYCSSVEESALIIVQSPDKEKNKQTEIVEYIEIKIPIHRNTPDFRGIAVAPAPSKRFEDIKFNLYDEEFPYLITTGE